MQSVPGLLASIVGGSGKHSLMSDFNCNMFPSYSVFACYFFYL